jgi:hypothetical protein
MGDSVYDLDGNNESIDKLSFIGGGDVETGSGLLTVDSDISRRAARGRIFPGQSADHHGPVAARAAATTHESPLTKKQNFPDGLRPCLHPCANQRRRRTHQGWGGDADPDRLQQFYRRFTVEAGRTGHHGRPCTRFSRRRDDPWSLASGDAAAGELRSCRGRALVPELQWSRTRRSTSTPKGALVCLNSNSWSGPVFLTKTAYNRREHQQHVES